MLSRAFARGLILRVIAFNYGSTHFKFNSVRKTRNFGASVAFFGAYHLQLTLRDTEAWGKAIFNTPLLR